MKEGTNSQYTAAIWSAVDTTLEGSGELYIRNNNLAGIQTGNADLTINDGNYSITANTYGLSVIGGTLTINDGYLQMNCGIDTIDPSSVTVINGGTIIDLNAASQGSSVSSTDSGTAAYNAGTAAQAAGAAAESP